MWDGTGNMMGRFFFLPHNNGVKVLCETMLTYSKTPHIHSCSLTVIVLGTGGTIVYFSTLLKVWIQLFNTGVTPPPSVLQAGEVDTPGPPLWLLSFSLFFLTILCFLDRSSSSSYLLLTLEMWLLLPLVFQARQSLKQWPPYLFCKEERVRKYISRRG